MANNCIYFSFNCCTYFCFGNSSCFKQCSHTALLTPGSCFFKWNSMDDGHLWKCAAVSNTKKVKLFWKVLWFVELFTIWILMRRTLRRTEWNLDVPVAVIIMIIMVIMIIIMSLCPMEDVMYLQMPSLLNVSVKREHFLIVHLKRQRGSELPCPLCCN